MIKNTKPWNIISGLVFFYALCNFARTGEWEKVVLYHIRSDKLPEEVSVFRRILY